MINEKDRKQLEETNSKTSYESKRYNFYCIFISLSKSSALKLCKRLREKHNFITKNPHRDDGVDEIWFSVAIKELFLSELLDHLEIIKTVAKCHNSESTFWKFEGNSATLTLSEEYVKTHDKEALEKLATTISDSLSPHEMECFFISNNEYSATELCDFLREEYNYKTKKLFQQEKILCIKARKEILYSDLEDTLRSAREAVNYDDNELAAWRYKTGE